ncbi:bifunctional DNA primase/polymerase [Prescottella equi]|uniref:bifunctional DNA primase/polymerase n=1 Tax=Rhodococcus hoagii TaxID=43767 RepID=UPI000A1190F9|nr:bifunctional DNA primase/polymerase [Prescottella equi]
MKQNSTTAQAAQQPRKSQRHKRIDSNSFIQSANELVKLGWHPVPLGRAKGKDLLVAGITGREGTDVSEEETFREWADRWADTGDGLNLGTRMPVGVIALDVDCYDGKPGSETMAACADEWGDLPLTWTITARDDGSSKLLYRVPEGWEGVGTIPDPRGGKASGVEVLQRHHRYAVVPPSFHEVGPVRVFGPDGNECELMPAPGELPMLPDAWCEGLHKNRPKAERDHTAEPDELLASFPEGPMTDAVQKAMQAMLDAIASGAGRHDTMNEKLLELLRLGWGGASGVPLAVQMLRPMFVQATTPERGEEEARAEFDRSLKGAAELVAGMGPSVAHAFQPGGIWHRDTGWVPHPDLPGLMKRGVVPSAGDDAEAVTVSSWTPADVATALDGDGPPKPSVLRRSDGAHLFYAGKVHSVHGESESGKSWVVQCAAAQELLGDGRVLYVDFEDDVSGVAGRLLHLGVPREVVVDPDRFVYVHPEESLNSDAARDAFAALVTHPFTLAVVDGVTDAMGVFGYSLTDNDDIAKWQRELPRRIASLSGAAVVCVDHVTKDADSRGRFAIGGEHKIAGLDGAAFTVEVDRPFGVGMAGVASIRVGKDRPGHVRGLGVGWRKQDRTQKVATFNLDGIGPVLAWNLTPPDDDSDSKLPAGAATRNSGGGAFRPTWFMEQVSRYWEEADDPAARTQNKTVTAMCEARKAAGKPLHRQNWRTAIEFLVNEGYASTTVGPRNAEVHNVVRHYRQTEDPASDAYTGGRTLQPVTDEDGKTRFKPKG